MQGWAQEEHQGGLDMTPQSLVLWKLRRRRRGQGWAEYGGLWVLSQKVSPGGPQGYQKP